MGGATLAQEDAKTNNEAIVTSISFTIEKVEQIRKRLAEAFEVNDISKKISVITTGSYARNEASEESDIDLFLIADEELDSLDKEISIIRSIIDEEIPKPSGSTNTFGADVVEPINVLVYNIGGVHDDNQKLTRRMLFLLEATWLFNEKKIHSYRRQLIEKYIKEGITEHQISKFFLNDIIRYYRTIATDFEYKVTEAGKSWGLRNIKLLFSRKLIYFSGILVAAETFNLPRVEKIDKTIELLSLTPLERISKLSKHSPTEIFTIYNRFLENIAQKKVRQSLDSVERGRRNENPEFLALKELGNEFSFELSKWLKETYSSGHPIHHSLLF
jgi:predicted nucleotidyltransferase